MDQETFQKFCALIYEKSGITLKEGKESLVSARIGKRMRANNIDNPRDYLRFIIEDKSGVELVHMIDAISTNLTYFFREPAHFDVLRSLFTRWKAEGQLRYRVWCAAASTGEEPYSLAMTILDVLGEGRSDTRILATDISTQVLQKCRDGVYDRERLKNVPPGLRERFFDLKKDAGGARYSAKPALRDMLVFKRLNLSTPPFPMRGPLDVVFCRNVMIYFDNPVRQNLIEQIFKLLKPGGYLMVGHSESLTGIQHRFKTVQPAVYLKPG
ncbi:MAG: protein-glutamate O-methyltransferase [bacterium]|nr:protein-glutamate O-methyltransferase [bacterium]